MPETNADDVLLAGLSLSRLLSAVLPPKAVILLRYLTDLIYEASQDTHVVGTILYYNSNLSDAEKKAKLHCRALVFQGGHSDATLATHPDRPAQKCDADIVPRASPEN